MEEDVIVPALSSSSAFNSKQWQLKQHEMSLIQQRQQLKKDEELKSSAQQCTKYTPLTQPAPHKSVATLTHSNVITKSAKQNLSDKVVEMINDENRKLSSEVQAEVTNNKSEDTSKHKNNETDEPPINFNAEATEDASGSTTTFSQTTVPSSCDDERPIKPLQG